VSLALACSSGGFRAAFTMGVLSAFEAVGLRAEAYAGTSASVIPAALAAVGHFNDSGMDYAQAMLRSKLLGGGMSRVALDSITAWSPFLRERLFQPETPRFCIPVSAVITPEATEQTQGKKARRLGRTLLMAATRQDRSWAATNLKFELFDAASADPTTRLTPINFEEVAYASTRMLHAWDIPAWIAGRPYIDASYTCLCPALEMARLGYAEVIAVSNESGALEQDLFGGRSLPNVWNSVPIQVIQPAMDLLTLDVDYTQATEDGMVAAFRHGEDRAREFLKGWHQS
jgi:hypothetical protein